MMLGKAHHISDESTCPGCGQKIDGASGFTSDEAPEVGDWTICAHCCCALIFVAHDTGLKVRGATLEDIQTLDADQVVVLAEVTRVVMEANRQRRAQLN